MRSQNPPPAHIKKAEELERYLRPTTLACLYALIATVWLAAIAIVLIGLVFASVLTPTGEHILIAATIGGIPALFVMATYLRRPNDPISRSLAGFATAWRRPLEVPPEECIFKTGLRKGDEMLLVKLAFHYPSKYQSLEVKERLYTFAHAALTSEFAMKYSLPSFQDIERALDPSMEMLATEYKIPVLYPEILDVRKMKVLYDLAELSVTAQEVSPLDDEYFATGTAG